jgi:hypothetical protein
MIIIIVTWQVMKPQVTREHDLSKSRRQRKCSGDRERYGTESTRVGVCPGSELSFNSEPAAPWRKAPWRGSRYPAELLSTARAGSGRSWFRKKWPAA